MKEFFLYWSDNNTTTISIGSFRHLALKIVKNLPERESLSRFSLTWVNKITTSGPEILYFVYLDTFGIVAKKSHAHFLTDHIVCVKLKAANFDQSHATNCTEVLWIKLKCTKFSFFNVTLLSKENNKLIRQLDQQQWRFCLQLSYSY